MAKTMQAVIKTKPEPFSMELATVPVPEITPEQVLVQVKLCGICGTDHALYHWSEAIASAYKLVFPCIFGHEFSGVIAEVGSAVTEGLSIGDRCTVNPIMFRSNDEYTAEGNVHICNDRPFLGTDWPGAFAQYVAVRAPSVVKISDNVSFKSGALIEPFSVAIHAVERVLPRFGDTCVVLGGGAIGLLVVKVLKWMGIKRIIVTGLSIDKARLAMAGAMGCTTIDVDEEDQIARVLELTGGKGAEVLFDTAGHSSTVATAVKMAAKRGRIGVSGLPRGLTELSMTEISLREISIIGNRAYTVMNYLQAARLLDQGLDIDDIGTHVLPLRDFDKAMQLLDQKQGLRILLEP